MRSSWKSVVFAVAALLVTPQLTFAADEVEEQLRLMQEQLNRVEDQLQATNDELDSSQEVVERQQSMIEKAGIDDRAGKSALSRFLEQTEFDGWVSVDWAWNFNGPPNDQNVFVSNFTGGVNSSGFTAPLHRDHNTFNLDQIWFSMRKEATEESRAGFGVQMVYGRTGDILGYGSPVGDLLGGAGASADTFIGNGNGLYIYEGYVEYLAPIWNGINVTAGRFATNIGYETIRAVDQPFVTRGITWAQQPVAHTGLKLDVDITENLNLMVGAANNVSDYAFETDNEKTFIGSLAYTGEKFGVSLNGLYGGDVVGLGGVGGLPVAGGLNLFLQRTGLGRTSDSLGILNFVGTYDPSENLHLFVDFHWQTLNGVPQDGDPELYGLAGGGRYAINDSTGFSLRAEYFHWDNANRQLNLFQNSALAPAAGGDRDTHGFAITSTIDHALTDQLTLKVEGRYDKVMVDGGRNKIFTCGSCTGITGIGAPGGFAGKANNKTDQVLALVQLLYRF